MWFIVVIGIGIRSICVLARDPFEPFLRTLDHSPRSLLQADRLGELGDTIRRSTPAFERIELRLGTLQGYVVGGIVGAIISLLLTWVL